MPKDQSFEQREACWMLIASDFLFLAGLFDYLEREWVGVSCDLLILAFFVHRRKPIVQWPEL